MARARFVAACRLLVAVTAAAVVLGVASPVDAASLTILDQTVPGPVGGAQVCIDTTCQTVQGVANLHVRATLNTSGITPPTITTSSQPGCTANVNAQVNVTTIGVSGTLDTVVEFDKTDQNGTVVGHATLPIPAVALTLAPQTHSVSVCARLL
ncbi:MAG: hypothetical protein ACRD12_21720 [Acidimicrobiales bacterium]